MGNPTVTPLSEQWHDGGFLVSMDNGHRSFEQITLLSGSGKAQAGTVLGLISTGASASSYALGTNTGNGTMGAITLVTTPTQVPLDGTSTYSLAYTDATHFTVTAPDGQTATGVNGTPFSALGIGFTMTSGATPMVAGDGFAITVTGKVGNPTATSAANAGNTGNATMGSVTCTGYAPQLGDYKLTLIEPATNAGVFQVEDPSGRVIGHGNVASAFSAGGISFTLADGATDFVSGDQFVIQVTAGSGKYRPWDPGNVDGSQVVAGILYGYRDATSSDQPAVAVVRGSEVNASELLWPTGANAAVIALGLAGLKSIGVIAR
jgi:hypothetical protein